MRRLAERKPRIYRITQVYAIKIIPYNSFLSILQNALSAIHNTILHILNWQEDFYFLTKIFGVATLVSPASLSTSEGSSLMFESVWKAALSAGSAIAITPGIKASLYKLSTKESSDQFNWKNTEVLGKSEKLETNR